MIPLPRQSQVLRMRTEYLPHVLSRQVYCVDPNLARLRNTFHMDGGGTAIGGRDAATLRTLFLHRLRASRIERGGCCMLHDMWLVVLGAA